MPVLYVHGNHEGYGEKLDPIRVELVDLCSMTNHIHYLDCTELLLGTTRFLGTTLWTDFRLLGDEERPAALQAAQDRMNDYRQIRLASQDYRKSRASDTARWHQQEKAWLARKLAEPFSGKTLVITHMAPSANPFQADMQGTHCPPLSHPIWTTWWRKRTCGSTAILMTRPTISLVSAEWSATRADTRETAITLPITRL